MALAQLYMDEILAKSFAERSPVGGGPVSAADADCSSLGPNGETRRTFNDVDDYHNLADTAPENSEEEPLPGYNSFRVAISVTCAGTDVGLASHEAKRIDITITDPSSNAYLFSAYRGNF